MRRYRQQHASYITTMIAMVFVISGCASTTNNRPGASNTTDSQIYDSLISIQASIEQAKVDFGTNPAAKSYLNKLIVAYNAAQDAYKTYHQHTLNGQNVDITELNAQISTLLNDLAKLQAQFGGTH